MLDILGGKGILAIGYWYVRLPAGSERLSS
jgi:hypothetical protein